MPKNEQILRVVVVRTGKVKPTEFRMRDGEIGLSLFRTADQPNPEAIIAAVRAAGKQGELGVGRDPGEFVSPESGTGGLYQRPAERPILGSQTPCTLKLGHPGWRRLVLRFRRLSAYEWFNERITPELAAVAKLVK